MADNLKTNDNVDISGVKFVVKHIRLEPLAPPKTATQPRKRKAQVKTVQVGGAATVCFS